MRRNGYLGASVKNMTCSSLREPRFPIKRTYFPYRMTFATYIWCFCAHFIWPWNFDLRPFDLVGVWWIKLRTSNPNTNFSILRV